MAHMHPYARDWIVLARATRVEAFATLYPGPFLLGCEIPDADYVFETRALDLGVEQQRALVAESVSVMPGEGETDRGPITQPTFAADEVWAQAEPSGLLDKGESRRWVIPIQKKRGAPAQHRIFVGRDAGNDICIPHPTVSKLQGYFSRPRGGTEEWSFLDADSANGTRWNRQSIPARQAIRVRNGDRLSFGQCEFFWLSAERLHADLLDMDKVRDRAR